MIKLAKISQIDDQKVVLDLEKNQECADCKSRCSDGFLSFLFHKKHNNKIIVRLNGSAPSGVSIPDTESFFTAENKINDVIGMKFNESHLFKLAFLLYGLPILLIVVTLILGVLLFQSMGLNTDLGGLIGLVSGLMIAKFMINSSHYKPMPKVIFFK